MKNSWFILCLASGLLFVHEASAQQMDESALEQAQSGQVSFMEGEFIAFLSDTISPDFALTELEAQGFDVVFSDINPIRLRIVNNPVPETLTKLEGHDNVLTVEVIDSPIDTASYRSQLIQQGMSDSLVDQAIQRIMNSGPRQTIYVDLDFHVTSNQVKTIMGNFRDVAYTIEQDYPKTVNIKTAPGEESAIMEKAEKLPFVKSTALIAVLGN